MAQEAQTHPISRFLPLWIVAGFLEIPFFEALFFPNPTLLNNYVGFSALTHLIAIILLFFSIPKGFGWFHGERLWARTFIFWLLYLPMIGWIISGVLFIGHTYFAKEYIFEEDEQEEETYDIYGKPYGIPTYSGDPSRRIFEELDVVPLVDIFKGEDSNLKRGAIERLVKMRTPEAIGVLQKYKKDSSPDIRFFINSGLTQIKKYFDDELKAAQSEMKQDYYKISARFFLAKEYLHYARSGLLDKKTSDYYEQEAIHHLNEVIKTPYASEQAYWMLIDNYLDLEEWDKALKVLNDLEKNRSSVNTKKIIKTKITIYFNTKQLNQLLKEFSNLKALGSTEPKWSAHLNWWGQGP